MGGKPVGWLPMLTETHSILLRVVAIASPTDPDVNLDKTSDYRGIPENVPILWRSALKVLDAKPFTSRSQITPHSQGCSDTASKNSDLDLY